MSETKSKTKAKALPERNIENITIQESMRESGLWAGSKDMTKASLYIYEKNGFNKKEVSFIPVLYKCVDELLVNAIDQYTTYPDHVKNIAVGINDEGEISISNDGPGIKIAKKKTAAGKEIYTPQMAFAEPLSSSNYRSKQEGRLVGGQNGIGAKIVCALSTYMVIETVDETNKLYYSQVYYGFKDIIFPPNIYNYETKTWVEGNQKNYLTELAKIDNKERKMSDIDTAPHTKITFLPQYDFFEIENFKSYIGNFKKILSMRAHQTATFVSARVTYNGEKLPKYKFADFCSLYEMKNMTFCDLKSKREKHPPLQVCIGLSDGKAKYLSIINGLFISDGFHFKFVNKAIAAFFMPRIEKELGESVTPTMLINNLFIIIHGYMPSPSFNSQSKDNLSGSGTKEFDINSYEFKESHLEKLWENFGEYISSLYNTKQVSSVKTKNVTERMDHIPKYIDAYNCRYPHLRPQCLLILTEGDSATGTATTGLTSSNVDEKFNYDWFGTYTLGGVPINGLKQTKKTISSGAVKKTKTARKLYDNSSTDDESDDEQKIKKEIKKATKKKSTKKITENSDAQDKCIEQSLLSIGTIRDTTASRLNDKEIKKLQEAVSKKHEPNSKVLKNKYLVPLIKVLCLDYDKTYATDEEFHTLRYGGIVGLTDQDLDGFNIFGLIATFFLTYWPELIRRGFVKRIQTPVI